MIYFITLSVSAVAFLISEVIVTYRSDQVINCCTVFNRQINQNATCQTVCAYGEGRAHV